MFAKQHARAQHGTPPTRMLIKRVLDDRRIRYDEVAAVAGRRLRNHRLRLLLIWFPNYGNPLDPPVRFSPAFAPMTNASAYGNS